MSAAIAVIWQRNTENNTQPGPPVRPPVIGDKGGDKGDDQGLSSVATDRSAIDITIAGQTPRRTVNAASAIGGANMNKGSRALR